MQPLSFDRAVQPNPQDARRADPRSPDAASPCDHPAVRQAIHRLRLTLDRLPE